MRATIPLALLCAAVVGLAPAGVRADASGRKPTDWYHVWPSEAPFKVAYGSTGVGEPGTGKNACSRFGWNGAGGWKIFSVKKGVPLLILAWGDSGCLGHLQFTILEPEDGGWKPTMSFAGPDWNGPKPDYEPGHRWLLYTPGSDRIRIQADNFGFYVGIYARGRQAFADADDRIKDRDLRKDCAALAQAFLRESRRIGEGQVIRSLLAMVPLSLAELRRVEGIRAYAAKAATSSDENVRAAAERLRDALR